MLTASQLKIVAFIGDGEIICRECATGRLDDGEADGLKPLTQYEMDVDQGEKYHGEDVEVIWGEDAANHTEDCLPETTCDACGAEIVEAYHYGHEEDS